MVSEHIHSCKMSLHKGDLEMTNWLSRYAPLRLILLTIACAGMSGRISHADATSRISLSLNGQDPSGFSVLPAVSYDGRYIAFASNARNLTSDPANGATQIYVRDRLSGATELISKGVSGLPGTAESLYPTISGDARFVAYTSSSSDLVSGDTNGKTDVFVYDRRAKRTQRISLTESNKECKGDSYHAAISANGNTVAFLSKAPNIVAGATGIVNVYLRDLVRKKTELVSVNLSGKHANGSCDFFLPSISADGVVIAFNSLASDLTAGDTNGRWDIFVRDRQSKTTTCASKLAAGGPGNSDSYLPSLTANGRYVVFYSWASNLIANDTNGRVDVFVADLWYGGIERVSVAADGSQSNGDSNDPSISADGRYVAFKSLATNLVTGSSNGLWHAYVYDRRYHTTAEVDVSSTGVQANGRCDFLGPKLSGDAQCVAYNSLATNLVAGDGNSTWDVYVGVVPAVKAGLPNFVTDSSQHTYLSITLYERGYGTVSLSGDWLFGTSSHASFQKIVDLSSGAWIAGTELQVPWETSLANPVISCRQASPFKAQTPETQCYVTGFIPADHGWQFANKKKWSNPLTWFGLCVGMSAIARNDFLYGPAISRENPITPVTSAVITGAHLSANIYIDGVISPGSHDLNRMVGYANAGDLFVNETSRLQDDIANGKPNVMLLKPQDKNHVPQVGGHAVVAIAAFFCQDAWVPGQANSAVDVQLFAVYDPNYPRQFRHVYVVTDGANYWLKFLPEVSDYSSFAYLGEFTKDK